MALNQIWKQQLTLVTYGNAFLTTDLDFNYWIEHPIFNQSRFYFRDLNRQILLAQHFQIWLEALKKQGVYQLSLHLSSILNDEENPNPNVELLPFTHFIVSHQKNKKIAWLCGQELAEWEEDETEFKVPLSQQSALHIENFWCYPLNDKLAKKIDLDLQKINWDDVHTFLQQELFEHDYVQDFLEPEKNHLFYGYATDVNLSLDQQLPLIPFVDAANVSHYLLHRFQALLHYLALQRQHPYDDTGALLSPEEQIHLRHFAEKAEDLFSKLIVKIANHYQSAYLSSPYTHPQTDSDLEPRDRTMEATQPFEPSQPTTVNIGSVIKLILFVVAICIAAYYFGF